MFTNTGTCGNGSVPKISGCKATTAATGITVADNGDITYATTSAATMTVTLMGCVD